jgi:hypothetical protein
LLLMKMKGLLLLRLADEIKYPYEKR